MLKFLFKWMPFWTTIIINLQSFSSAHAQTIEQTLNLANIQYQNQNFASAINNYQRVLFFDENQKYPDIHQKLADCYFAENKMDKALFEYNVAYNLETSDSVKNELTFKRVLLLIVQDNCLEANFELLSMNDSLSPYFSQRRSFYQGIVFLQTDSVLNAKNSFLEAIQPSDSISRQRITKLFSNYNPQKPNPKIARNLSIFVPGLGQLYNGDYKNAANSFILSGALITLLFAVAVNYTFIDAMASVIPYFQRYYFGGMAHAKKGAYEKRDYNRKKLLNQLFTIFENRTVTNN